MPERILVCDDERTIRENLAGFLADEGFEVDMASDGSQAVELLSQSDYAVLVCDLKMPGMDGLQVLKRAIEISPQTFVLIITAYATVETAVQTLKMGAQDYLIKPLIFEDIQAKIEKLIQYRQLKLENRELRRELNDRVPFEEMDSVSPAMQKVFELIEKVAPTGSTVLITGDSGTGKEVVARAIHRLSPRAEKLFVPVNLCAMPETLLEAQLFGYIKGAFTGAVLPNEGLFKAAIGGTIFLDEIAELPLAIQPKLLRVVERKEVMPIGETKPLTVDVRIIIATNRNMETEVKEGRFREDLFYRLNVIEVHVPPLSERREDIPVLVESCLRKHCRELRREIKGVSNEAMRLLVAHEWKGNVRELENVLERALILSKGPYIEVDDLPPAISGKKVLSAPTNDLRNAIKTYERQHIHMVLERTGGDKKKAAAELGLSLSSLYRKIEELNLPTKDPSSDPSDS